MSEDLKTIKELADELSVTKQNIQFLTQADTALIEGIVDIVYNE